MPNFLDKLTKFLNFISHSSAHSSNITTINNVNQTKQIQHYPFLFLTFLSLLYIFLREQNQHVFSYSLMSTLKSNMKQYAHWKCNKPTNFIIYLNSKGKENKEL